MRIVQILSLVVGCAALAGCVSVDPTPASQQPLRQAEAKRDLGMDHLAKGRTAMAIRDLREAEKMNPDDAEMHLWLGEAYRRKNKLEAAESHMRRAMELDADSHLVQTNLAGLLIQLEHYDEAIELFDQLADDPTYPAPWRALANAGWAHYKAGRVAQAREVLSTALDYSSDYWPALLNLGIIDSEQGRNLDAIERFQEVLGSDPGKRATSETNYRLGEVYVSLGRRDRAIRYFTSSIEESPRGQWGKRSKRYLKLLR